MSIKIAFITENFFPHVGGVEKYFLDIAKSLISKGFEVRIITSNSGGVTGFYNFEGLDCYAYNWFAFANHSIPNYKDLEEHVKWADLIHTTTYTAGPMANFVAKKYKKPCVIIVHEVLGTKWNWIEKNPIMALAYRLFELFCVKQNYDFYLCNSFATQQDLQNVIPNKTNIKTIYLSVEYQLLKKIKADRNYLNSYFGLSKDQKVFMYYGRPGQPKGIFVYLDAIKMLVNTDKVPANYKFIFLLSKKPEKIRKNFEDIIRTKNLQKYIIVRDSVSHEKLYPLVKAADFIVVPSITEGFGFTCVESCTLGCSVIHSSAGSLPEVAFGKTKSFENRNSKELSRILDETIHGVPFKQTPEIKFCIDNHINDLIPLYKEILSDN